MNSVIGLYAKLLSLLVLLTIVISFNVVVWGLHRHPMSPALYVPGADPVRGKQLVRQYGCGSCHIISGIRSATGNVGPQLDRMNENIYVGGVLPNTPENLTSWIANPKQADPRTAMPNLNVRPADARDIAAYLYAQ